MSRYRVLEKSFINGKIAEAGDVVHYDGQPGGNLELVEGGSFVYAAPAPVAAPLPTPLGIRLRADGKYISIWCAGCRCGHTVPIDGSRGWQWNPNTNTLTPSVRHYHTRCDPAVEVTDCHYNVTNGRILYHADSLAHSLRGEMELRPFPEGYGT